LSFETQLDMARAASEMTRLILLVLPMLLAACGSPQLTLRVPPNVTWQQFAV
jgi:hypothetical protein